MTSHPRSGVIGVLSRAAGTPGRAVTGGGRTLMAYKITDECLACGACIDECPNEAISEGDEIYEIDAAKCDDCGTCVDSCPNDAIVPAD